MTTMDEDRLPESRLPTSTPNPLRWHRPKDPIIDFFRHLIGRLRRR